MTKRFLQNETYFMFRRYTTLKQILNQMKKISYVFAFSALLASCSSGAQKQEEVQQEVSAEVEALNQEVEVLEQESANIDAEVDALLESIEE